MTKSKKIIAVVLTLSLCLFLSACEGKVPSEEINDKANVENNEKSGEDLSEDEQNENQKDEEKNNEEDEDKSDNKDEDKPIEDEEPLLAEDIELNLGEKAKIGVEEIKGIYQNDADMLLRINDFVGKKAPNFKLTDLEGEEMELSDFEGENLILEFMGTWCPACVNTISTNEDFNENREDAKIIGIGVNDDNESLQNLKDEHDIKNTKYFVPEEGTMEAYDLAFVPLYVFIDNEGYVQMLLAGDAPIDMIEEYAEKSFK